MIPGCNVESTIFLACHSSGVISLTSPFLYAMTACLACSRPVLPARRVLIRSKKRSARVRDLQEAPRPGSRCDSTRLTASGHAPHLWGPTATDRPRPGAVEVGCCPLSPRIRDASRVPHAAPVGTQVVLRRRQLAAARQRRRHAVRIRSCPVGGRAWASGGWEFGELKEEPWRDFSGRTFCTKDDGKA